MTLSDGAADGVYLIRRKAWDAKWGKRKPQPHPFDGGFIQVKQTPADFAAGANYELTAYEIDEGASARAAIDFPPGAESLGWQGTESIRAFPLVRTEDAILLWIRADTGIRQGAIDAVASATGKRRTWRVRQPAPGPCAYLLIDNLFPGMELELTLTITAGATGATGLTASPHPRRGSFPRRPLRLREGYKRKINPFATGLKGRWASDSATPPGRTRRKMLSGSPAGSGRKCLA